MADHKCPKTGCNKQVPSHMLACRNHWFEVPKSLRDAIWDSYRNNNKGAHSANVQEAIRLLSK